MHKHKDTHTFFQTILRALVTLPGRHAGPIAYSLPAWLGPLQQIIQITSLTIKASTLV
jgi:hypothetical protein